MADFGSPVVNASTAMNPMQPMSQVMGLKLQQQQLQQQQIETQKKQITFGEQQALGQIQPKFGDDGVVDAEDYARRATQATPFTGLGQERAGKVAEVTSRITTSGGSKCRAKCSLCGRPK